MFLGNCETASLTFNGSTNTVNCNTSHYFAAPTQAGEIVVVSKEQTKKTSYASSDFEKFETQFFIMMYYPITFTMRTEQGALINRSDFNAIINSTQYNVAQGTFTFMPF